MAIDLLSTSYTIGGRIIAMKKNGLTDK